MSDTKQSSEELKEIVRLTLDYYNQKADDFFAGTIDHDVEQNISALLQHIEGSSPFTILDVGCGPGRDLKSFTERGHVAVGLEGAARFVDIARSYSGCDVWLQDFITPVLPASYFDGIYANASLFHVPSQILPVVLLKYHAALKPNGVLFSSNPRGMNEEGWAGGRYGAYYDLSTWSRYMKGAGFVELMHYYRPEDKPREQQPWLASVWRKN